MEKLLTPFGKNLDKDLPLNEYPRPQMRRNSFLNLNGRWKYAIRDKEVSPYPYQGEIIVPFSPECILSGVERIVKPSDILYYYRKFEFKKDNARALLHFGAVDYLCTVKLNGRKVGTHAGGYFPFTFDVTDSIIDGENEIEIEVTDPSETGPQARGKQTTNRGGIWYTPQSGIWQTVWIEQVADNYIKSFKVTPDIDRGELNVEIEFSERVVPARISVFDKGAVQTSVLTETGQATLKLLFDYELWSPENPYLYDLKISAGLDEVDSYFGMRKYSVGRDMYGVPRLMLNNKPYFHNGLLDQGYWSDGMYTAPTDEALIYDIETMKKMGFNMLRKHLKIEPLRWYYHCDRLGMIVWQDMISGGVGKYSPFATMIRPAFNMLLHTKKLRAKDTEKRYKYFSRKEEEGRKEFYTDSERMIDGLYNVVSIAVWVPFNEGWGQFDSEKVYDFYKEKDYTRIVDHASGFHDQGCGDLNSFHIYLTPYWFPKFNKKDRRPIVLSEYGGYSFRSEGHMFSDKFFGYKKFKKQEKFDEALEKLFTKKVKKAIAKGVSATVYTEVSDVEDECNGLLSYDRQVIKTDIELMKKINESMKFDWQ